MHPFSRHIFCALKHGYPKSAIHFSECSGSNIINHVLKNKVNLGFAICRSQSVYYKKVVCEKNDLVMEPLFDTELCAIFPSTSALAEQELIDRDSLQAFHMLVPDGMIHPSDAGTVKPSDNLGFYQNMDSFSNYAPIFDILLQDQNAASLIPLCWQDHMLVTQGALRMKNLCPTEEQALQAYVVYRKQDASPILETALTLLRALKDIYGA